MSSPVSPRRTIFLPKPCIILILILLVAMPSHQAAECGGPLKPEVIKSTAFSSLYPASSVLILGEVDAGDDNGQGNFWLAEGGKTTGQGFTIKVDTCTRLIAGCQIKNKGKEMLPGGWNNWWSSKGFRVSGSLNENGPWETLVEDQLVDTTFSGGKRPASLLNFTFEEAVEIQFLKFDLISYWGESGGGLQYFAAIPATSGPTAETTTDSDIGTTTDEVTNATKEPSLDSKINIGLFFLISIPIAFTIFGLIYIIRTNCKIRQKCCKCCGNDLVKEDENLDYGTYYYDADGERRQDVMEVEDSNPAYESVNAAESTI